MNANDQPVQPDLPAPIPWLGGSGLVLSLDAPSSRTEGLDRLPPAGPSQPDSPPVSKSGSCGSKACGCKGSKASATATGDVKASPASAPAAPPEQAVSAAAVAAPGAAPAKPQKKDPKRPGSGIPARRSIRTLVWVRRAAQIGFFALFMFFLFQTAFRGTFSASADQPVRLPYPVEAFLLADPFVAAMTLLSTHAIYRGLAWSLGVLALTLIFGRVFCGWICPFGTIHHFLGWILPSRALKGGKRVDANKTHWWQAGKYYLMWGFLGAAMVGSAIGGLLDPICVAVRAVGLGIIPALQYLGIRTGNVAAETNMRAVQGVADGAQDVLSNAVWTVNQAYFHQTWLILFLLLAILFLNRFVPRFWCRALCPLGAFLGVFARFSLFGMEKDHAKCTDCNLCLVNCQGADSPQGGVKHRQDECHMCLNCENACPEDVIKFRFLPNRKSTIKKPDLARRTMIASGVAGAAVIPAMRVANWPDRAYSEKVIRPPGSVEEREFLERCIRCAECMKVCPNNALHPAFFEAGLEGLWTPILIPRIGYCEFSCVLCGQVCPTGAIQKITEKEKMGLGQKPVSIGTAMYDQGRCLPWSMATPCIVCEEFCPTSPKAIWAEEVDVPKRDSHYDKKGEHPKMLTIRVQRPHVDPSLCIGCGACEKVCPIVDKPAVYVTNAGETRSKTNVILLENTSYTS